MPLNSKHETIDSSGKTATEAFPHPPKNHAVVLCSEDGMLSNHRPGEVTHWELRDWTCGICGGNLARCECP